MGYEKRSDQELLALIGCDDVKALQVLWARHYDSMCRYVIGYIPTIHNPDDAVVAVFERLWQMRKTLKPGSTRFVKSYLYTAARNQARNLHRRNGGKEENVVDWENFADTLDSEEIDTPQKMMNRELLSEVDALIATLPPRRAEIFRLSRIEGLTYREIADTLGILECTVQKHMMIALKELQPDLHKLRRKYGRV